jgi:serine/threonine protein phosphatase PrpC
MDGVSHSHFTKAQYIENGSSSKQKKFSCKGDVKKKPIKWGAFNIPNAKDEDSFSVSFDGSADTLSDRVSSRFAFFSVFDGHGGSTTSRFCADHIHDRLMEKVSFVLFDQDMHMIETDFFE